MSDTLRAQNGAVLRGEGREEPLDLDALTECYTKRHEGECEPWCCHDEQVLIAIAELRRLREENAALATTLAGKRVAGLQSGDRSPDGTNRLCVALYGHEDVTKWLGGANAQFLHDAADEIDRLREETTQLDAILLDLNLELARLREENARLTRNCATAEAETAQCREIRDRLGFAVEDWAGGGEHLTVIHDWRRFQMYEDIRGIARTPAPTRRRPEVL